MPAALSVSAGSSVFPLANQGRGELTWAILISTMLAVAEQRRASENHTLPFDALAEIEKLEAADILVLQFSLWWHGPPARGAPTSFGPGARGEDMNVMIWPVHYSLH